MKACCVFFMILAGVGPLIANEPTIQTASEFYEEFENAKSELNKPAAEFIEKYKKQLTQLRQHHELNNSLEGALEVKEHIEAFETSGQVTAEAKDPNLLRLQEIYLRETEKLNAAAIEAEAALLRKFGSRAVAAKNQLTTAGQLEEAKAYQLQIEALKKALEDQQLQTNNAARPSLAMSDPDWFFIKDRIDNKKLIKTKVLAPGGGGPFEHTHDEPGVLVGFALHINPKGGFMVVHGVKPIFRTEKRMKVVSTEAFGAKNGREVEEIVAKKGYAVGKIEGISAGPMRQLKVHFYRISGRSLDPKDSYSTDWLGEWEGRKDEGTVDTEGKLPIGIHGSQGLGLDSIGLIVLEP